MSDIRHSYEDNKFRASGYFLDAHPLAEKHEDEYPAFVQKLIDNNELRVLEGAGVAILAQEGSPYPRQVMPIKTAALAQDEWGNAYLLHVQFLQDHFHPAS